MKIWHTSPCFLHVSFDRQGERGSIEVKLGFDQAAASAAGGQLLVHRPVWEEAEAWAQPDEEGVWDLVPGMWPERPALGSLRRRGLLQCPLARTLGCKPSSQSWKHLETHAFHSFFENVRGSLLGESGQRLPFLCQAVAVFWLRAAVRFAEAPEKLVAAEYRCGATGERRLAVGDW